MKKYKNISLETSSYLPLIWITPYSQGVLDWVGRNKNATFYIQEDCLKEALSYFNFKRNWFRDPVVRLKHLAETLTDRQIKSLSFPSTAFQILLGGKIWPSRMYLNFVRHTTFLYADLADDIDFRSEPRNGLYELAEKIDKRFEFLKTMIKNHFSSESFKINFKDIIPYWGCFYVSNVPTKNLRIIRWKVPQPFIKGSAKIRDLYHYESMIKSNIKFDMMIVANTGFAKWIKNSKKDMPIEIVCSLSKQNDIYLEHGF